MAIATSGRNKMAQLLIGEAVNAYNNSNAYIGVGNGTTAFSAAQTDNQGASKARKAMDASYPQRSTNVLTFQSTFASGDANFAWEEIALFDASTSGVMFSRLVQAMGTKASGSTWVATLAITLTVA